MNCTPYVRQNDIASNIWGDFMPAFNRGEGGDIMHHYMAEYKEEGIRFEFHFIGFSLNMLSFLSFF